jgi:Zn-dependent protease
MQLPNFLRGFRFGRDRTFWMIVGGLFLVYVLTRRDVASILETLVALLIGITIHECAHAWAADQLGDSTARIMGRVSLNPLVHLDPLGTAMMLFMVLGGMGIGWGKPTPVSPFRLRYGPRLGNALVALAGPISNLVCAVGIGLVLRLALYTLPESGVAVNLFLSVLYTIVLVNITLAVFNLLPIPPLDGHCVLLGLLSLSRSTWAWKAIHWIDGLAQYGPMLLLGVIVISQIPGLNIFGLLIVPPTRFLLRAIVGL